MNEGTFPAAPHRGAHFILGRLTAAVTAGISPCLCPRRAGPSSAPYKQRN